jgi:hypothetical protein
LKVRIEEKIFNVLKHRRLREKSQDFESLINDQIQNLKKKNHFVTFTERNVICSN